jgi:hypothetical protein
MLQMNEELKKAAEEILSGSGQSQEFQRRLLKLLENVTTSNYHDADVRQVIELTDVSEEE